MTRNEAQKPRRGRDGPENELPNDRFFYRVIKKVCVIARGNGISRMVTKPIFFYLFSFRPYTRHYWVIGMELTFLGTGTSVGVPVIGCRCDVCTSSDPRNRRTRSSVHVSVNDTSIVIDTSVDFRQQLIRESINRVDMVLFTHAHADHIMGLDDVRPLNSIQDQPIDCYGDADTLEIIRDTFDYMFRETANDSWTPEVNLHPLEEPGTIQGVSITPLPVEHGEIDIQGYRIGDLAYICDVSAIPDETMALLDDLEVLVLDALRDTPHPTHLTIDRAVELAEQIGAHRTFFTHITHDVGHEERLERSPDSMRPAHDGLSVKIDDESSPT
jgi:phosphoribosyl 1,2-cyclic phosphate phosphodiesterase